MDTNTIPQLAPAAVSTFNAWHIIALGVGAAVTHIYHVVVNAGGVRRIWANFWGWPSADLTTKDSNKS